MRSIKVMATGLPRKALAASSPPKPQPMMMTRGGVAELAGVVFVMRPIIGSRIVRMLHRTNRSRPERLASV